MSNVRRGNSWYVDSTGTLETGSNIKVVGVIVTPTASNGYIVLSETSASSTTKARLGGSVASETLYFDLASTPLVFSGLYVLTASNAVATIILSERGNS